MGLNCSIVKNCDCFANPEELVSVEYDSSVISPVWSRRCIGDSLTDTCYLTSLLIVYARVGSFGNLGTIWCESAAC